VSSVAQMTDGRARAARAAQGRQQVRTPQAKRSRTQRSRVAEFQRARLLRSAIEVASERGYSGISVTAVIVGAKVSSKTFYEFFENAEDCLASACEQWLAEASRFAEPAFAGKGSWSDRLRRALSQWLTFLDSQPEAGKLAVAFLLGAGTDHHGHTPAVDPRVRRTRLLSRLAEGLSEAREDAVPQVSCRPLTSEVLVAAALGVIHSRLARVDGPAIELVNPLMSLLVLPFLGAEAAAAELKRKPARTSGSAPSASPDPVADLGIRLTYRTAHVIAVIADGDGLSNAEVALAAGVRDQGQISKLLHRLAAHGVIINTQSGRATGLANAWSLSAKGLEVHSAIEHRALRDRTERDRSTAGTTG